jgi:hypothetical protein
MKISRRVFLKSGGVAMIGMSTIPCVFAAGGGCHRAQQARN